MTNKGIDNEGSSPWSPQEREIAVRMRGIKTHKGISEILNTYGYNRTPKAVERFFSRVAGATDAMGPDEITPATILPNQRPLKTSWGDPLLVQKLKIEFGRASSLVPVAIIPDIHSGFHDDYAIDLACKVLEVVKPVALVYLGDNVDWVQISKYDKDPERMTKTAEEVALFQSIDRRFVSAVGNHVRRYYILGNHELRMYSYYCKHPEIIGFKGMRLDAILGTNEEFQVIPNLQLIEREISWRDKFLFKHGDKVSKWSCYTAKMELDKEQISGISGHTHRAAEYYLTNRGKSKVWTESGCLCKLDPEYTDNPNWQQAVTIGWFNADGKTDYFHTDLITFNNYQAIVQGNFIKVK